MGGDASFHRFLELPLELRCKIYSYLLPYTHEQPRREPPLVGWFRGQTSLLRVCHQVHDECADLLYGTNLFVIELAYDRIEFLFRWMLPSALIPKRLYTFPDHFSVRNRARIRNYLIHIEQLDSYMGMIKYNCGGKGLLVGVRNQIAKLVGVLEQADRLGEIRVYLGEGGRLQDIRRILDQLRTEQDRREAEETNAAETQIVLEPFRNLHTAGHVEITGAVTETYGHALERAMTGRAEA